MKVHKLALAGTVVAAVVLVGVFAYSGFNRSVKWIPKKETGELAFSFQQYYNSVLTNMQTPEKERADSLWSCQQKGEAVCADTLFSFWYAQRHPEIAAHFYIRQKDTATDDSVWLKAGLAYYAGSRMQPDSAAYVYFLYEAKKSFDRAYALREGNLDARAYRAICNIAIVSLTDRLRIMENDNVPELRRVLELDSNHVPSIYMLGLLSIESGQYDKALQRFEKLISLQPFNAEYYLLYAEVHLRMGNKQKAKEFLLKAKDLAQNPFVRQSADELLKEAEAAH